MLVLPPWLKRSSPAIVLILAAILLAPSYWVALHTPATGIYHDDSLYLITAKALAEGRGYTIESTPQAMPQTKYPVLFPALLAIVWKLSPQFPANLIYFKLIPLLATLIWLVLSFHLLKRQTGNALFAAGVIALTASSSTVVFLSSAVLSETTFAALTTGSLMLWLRHQRTGKQSDLVLAAALAAAAFHTRTIGITVIGAGLAALLLSKKYRAAFEFGLVCVTATLPWFIWQFIHRGAYDPYLSQANYYTKYNILLSFSWGQKIQIALKNLLFLPFSLQALFDQPWAAVLGVVAIPFAIRGVYLAKLPLVVRAFIWFTIGIIVLWAWPPLRFLIPVLPVLIWAVWMGVPGKFRPLFLVIILILFWVSSYACLKYSKQALSTGLWYPLKHSQNAWRDFERQLDWIKQNTEQHSLIQSNVDPTIYLFTGRKAIRGSFRNASLAWYLDEKEPLGSPTDFEEILSKNDVDFVVSTPWPWFFESELFAKLVAANTNSLQPVHKGESGNFVIYRRMTMLR
jgi:hypothetical protein